MSPDQQTAIRAGLEERFGAFEVLNFESRGPSVGAEVARNAALAVAMAAAAILVYLTVMFRSVPHPFRYGACAIIAMLHDVGVVVGLASIMGWLFGWEVDALFLTALLTVIGFSVHDSIVVFDRIRENVSRLRGQSFERVVNHSIVQTLDRSINTQLTAVFTLTAIWLYSQGHLQRFVFWLLVGIVSGTYSSIFNAAPLLVVWENREWRRWFGREERLATTG
jgi:preprotein translocase subunit SecF